MIYFIQSQDGPIKIGKATNPQERLSQLQGSNSYKLSLLATMNGNEKEEKMLHSRFEELKIRGEWFAPSPELLLFIQENAICSDRTAFWMQLCTLEPRLLDLLKESAAIKDAGKTEFFCANHHWYKKNGLKEKLSKLVGWQAEKYWIPPLKTIRAYDAAFRKIYYALPNCRGNCSCFR